MKRSGGRKPEELREISFEPDYQIHPDGSVLAVMGRTKVVCSVFIQEGVPGWISDETSGWATSEYDMLPGSTAQRIVRDSVRGHINARTSEIKRLIGRAVRSVLDLKKVPGKTVWIDCDVLQADGGTRTASVNGAYVALKLAVARALNRGKLQEDPIRDDIAAVSVGVCGGQVLLDLNYEEDSRAEADMNIVMSGSGLFVEIQATGEKRPFTEEEFLCALSAAKKGISRILQKQRETIDGYSPRNK